MLEAKPGSGSQGKLTNTSAESLLLSDCEKNEKHDSSVRTKSYHDDMDYDSDFDDNAKNKVRTHIHTYSLTHSLADTLTHS